MNGQPAGPPLPGDRFRRALRSIFGRTRRGGGPPGAQTLPSLSGGGLEHYHLERRLGEGHNAIVYLATDDSRRSVALKVLHPDWATSPDLRRHLEANLRTISRISHPHLVRVYRFGTSDQGSLYVAMAVAARGTLRQLLGRGRLQPDQALQVLDAVAQALHIAHEHGVTHYDVKAANVLFDSSGRALLADFGTPRTSFGLLGTPGSIAPEQVLGLPIDSRVDVYALGVLAFEMLTGASPFLRPSPPETILASAQAQVPSAAERNRALGEEVDLVLARALAKVPEERYRTGVDFVRDLARVPPFGHGRPNAGPAEPAADEAPALPGSDAMLGTVLFEQSVAKLEEILSLALTAAVIIDESSFVVGWNAMAEQVFGWSREEILGRSLVSTLVPPQYRERHRHGLQRYLDTGEGPMLGQKQELSALHRDGRELPVELSITEAVRSRGEARILAFMRDISQERLFRRMVGVRAAVRQAVEEAGTVREAAGEVLRSLGELLGWSAATLWLVDGDPGVLRCVRWWHTEELECRRLEERDLGVELRKGEGVAGRVWARGEPLWFEDVAAGGGGARATAADMRTAVGLPIFHAGEVRGAVELFSCERRSEDPLLLSSLYELGRLIGRGPLR